MPIPQNDSDMISVLLAPAHYNLNDIYGSEETWPLNLIRFVTSAHDVEFEVISNRLSTRQNLPRTHFTTIGRKTGRIGLFERLVFVLDVFLRGRKILASKDIQIIHHMLPYGLFSTFNLLFLLKKRKYRYVIGPIMLPGVVGDGKMGYFQFDRENRTPNKLHRFLLDLSILALGLTKPILKYLHIKTIQNADAVMFLDEKTRKFYFDIVPGIEKKEVELVTFGIDTGSYKYRARTNRSPLEILALNRLDLKKGTNDVISAVAKIIKKKYDIVLRIVGDGPEADMLKKQVEDLGITDRVIFEGWVPNVKIPEYYDRADIYCNMSDETYYGLVTIEAMACGLPMVRTTNPNVARVVEDGKSGFLVPVGDVEALEKTLIELIENEALRVKVGANARKAMLERFDWRIIAQKQVDLYRKLITPA